VDPLTSAQLAVLAAAAVVAAERGLLLIVLFLARHTQAHARHGLAPRLGNRRAALLAMLQARTFAHVAARALDRVLDRRVDLILNGVVACPTCCHCSSSRIRCARVGSVRATNFRKQASGGRPAPQASYLPDGPGRLSVGSVS